MNKNNFSIDSILKEQELRNNKIIKIYDYIYSKTEFIIKKSVKMGQSYCYYDVPNFIFGYPAFNQNEATQYILNKLTENGFVPFLIRDNYICITWPVPDKKSKVDTRVKNEESENLDNDDFVNSLIRYKKGR